MLHRKVYLGLTLFGMIVFLTPLVNVLSRQDFIVCAVGLGFIVIGVFSAMESTASKKNAKG